MLPVFSSSLRLASRTRTPARLRVQNMSGTHARKFLCFYRTLQPSIFHGSSAFCQSVYQTSFRTRPSASLPYYCTYPRCPRFYLERARGLNHARCVPYVSPSQSRLLHYFPTPLHNPQSITTTVAIVIAVFLHTQLAKMRLFDKILDATAEVCVCLRVYFFSRVTP